jgi:hypothetical protein
MPPLSDTHWRNIGDFIFRKSKERKLSEAQDQIQLFREFWTELSDETLMQTEADTRELSDLESTVANEDSARPNIDARIQALKTKLGRGSGAPGQSGRGRPK